MQLDFHHTDKTFIVAVSGGVDSVSLLHALIQKGNNNKYIVAHVNHGIREDAQQDVIVTRDYANKYNLPFEYKELQLDRDASEAEARTARYAYLSSTVHRHKACAIITAHHQDDVIETMFINIVRGTGRRGLSSLKSDEKIIRPLLAVPKSAIYEYAQKHALTWHEDSTNRDTRYLRNSLRHNVVAHMNDAERSRALAIIENASRINQQLDKELTQCVRAGLHKGGPVLNRKWFTQLPHDVALEILYTLLRSNGVSEINRPMLERTVVAVKTMRPGKTMQLSGGEVIFTKRSARIKMHRKTDENTV